jgi:hypothetical protein
MEMEMEMETEMEISCSSRQIAISSVRTIAGGDRWLAQTLFR